MNIVLDIVSTLALLVCLDLMLDVIDYNDIISQKHSSKSQHDKVFNKIKKKIIAVVICVFVTWVLLY